MARLFAAEGAAVVVCDIKAENAEALASQISESGGKAIALGADITRAIEVDRIFSRTTEEFGGLDILVNNAVDVTGDTTLSELTEEVFDRVIAIGLKAPYLCSRRALPLFHERGGGNIVTISSVNALFGFGHTAYTAAKGGLISMMRLVAAEYGDQNIRSIIICPGTIETATSMGVWEANPEGYAQLKAMYPMGRIGKPVDVANCALFLASAEASFVTGSVYVVDGGILAGRKFDF
jgi:NAD(P)-dependent dehydrogenase (short-subunit alcohol dehydrogenase family)